MPSPDPSTQTDADESAALAQGAGVVEGMAALGSDLFGLFRDHVEVAALEIQRAGESLVSIIVFGIVAGVLLAAAWLAAASVIVLWLIEHGIAASAAMALAVVLNLVGVYAILQAIRRRGRHFGFPATLRSLAPRTAAPPGPTT
ncbi:MAG TPA: phage holin family protein [Steroidobacteraceae bacterium]